MSKDTTNVPGMDNATAGYLAGKIKDGETLVGEELYNDIMQFFQKLMSLAGLAANDTNDNETNGYQFVDALIAKVRATTATTTLKGTVEKATTAEAQAGTADKFLDGALLKLVTATESRKGVAEIATTAEAKGLTDDSRIISPKKLSDVTGGLLTKVVDIGNWDMSALPLFVSVPHGLDYDKIIGHKVTIRSDAADIPFKAPIEYASSGNIGGFSNLGTTNVNVSKLAGGYYDLNSAEFNQTPYNRGWIIIYYLP